MTLEEIGQEQDCTRENIRLHLKVIMDKASTYILNKSDLFKDVIDTIKEHILIKRKDVSKIISNKTGEYISNKDEPFICFLLDLLKAKEKHNYVYIQRPCCPSFDQCISLRNNIIDLLNDQPENYTLPEIRNLLHKDLDLDILKDIIKDIPDVEECKSETSAILYCIPIEKLKYNESLIYRVLYEHGTKMTKQDIFKEIMRITGKESINFFIKGLNGHIDTIGKTGYWVLKKWEVDTNIMINSIINVFKSINNTPTQMKDLCELIQKNRSDIMDTTIKSYIYNTYNYMFSIKDNKVSVKQKYLKNG
jgi:energy-converting hydrogenase A subunit M